ncbi:hypothetical protein niasHS_004422 [Heterodera schachtii]|uniref:Uncharacterized protein n=1 Tax=Heterodera schachtii TaxID=97005 RepID=A0ABD2K130_HETSC
MKRHSDGCFTETSKKGKFSKRLPIELLWELIMCIPMMRLFDGRAEKKRWLSMIDPINWQFEVVRQSRKNEHNAFKNRLAMLNEKFNQTCELRKVPFDNEQLLSAVFRIKDQLLMEQYFAEILQYLCFSRFNRGVVTDNFSVASPLINSIVNGKLCGQLIDFILCSPNPFCIRKRICVGVMLPKDLPTCLNQTACEMNRNGILPQVRSDGNTVYLLFNAHLMKKVGYISMFYHKAPKRIPGGKFFCDHAKRQFKKRKPKQSGRVNVGVNEFKLKMDGLPIKSVRQFKKRKPKQSRRVIVGVKELELKMDGLTIKSGTNSEQMPEENPQPFDHSMNSTSALLPTNIGAGGTHISFGTAFASEFLTDAKNRLNAKIEEIEARILYFLARDSKLKALNQLGAEIEREVNVLENMFP